MVALKNFAQYLLMFAMLKNTKETNAIEKNGMKIDN